MILSKPFLARCTDRSKKPINHPSGYSPENWLNQGQLDLYQFNSISFDFFVNWSFRPPLVTPIIWLKAILNEENSFDELKSIIQDNLNYLFGANYISNLIAFAEIAKLKVEIIIYKDQADWSDDNSDILRVIPKYEHQNGITFAFELLTLKAFKNEIRINSGGPVKIGRKGLTYGTSRLECALSNTDSLYPGDVDCILLDSNFIPKAILEYKKHNLSTPIKNQRLSNYYPSSDLRKYDRLAILRDYLTEKLGIPIPLINIYYPTIIDNVKGKIELVTGEVGKLKSAGHALFTLNDKDTDGDSLMKCLIRGLDHFEKK